ncbi:GNAT family N-acetyltransferase [Gordonia sp. DT218]|uniref:GNAT family N-acetyltransferase n=1 Tax=Gordonia sp. DT218 TaxID=3416659 RepID=UPI003CF900F5
MTLAPSPSRTGVTRPLLMAGPVVVGLTEDPADIVEIQELRYRVFGAEPGFADVIGDPVTGRDGDRFDEFCEHLVVRHADDGLIGSARLLSPARAAAAGGWYTGTEFDVHELAGIASDTVEMGRAVVAPGHRQGTTTALMWAALLHHLDETCHRYLMGCVSVPLNGPGPRGSALRGVRDVLRDRYQAPWQVYPHLPANIGGRRLDDIGPPDVVAVPALMRGYLRLGARVCGEPALDAAFDVGDFVTVLDRLHGNNRYLERMQSCVDRLAVGARK